MPEFNGLQQQQWRLLSADLTRLPHAMLFAGARGVGKLETAMALAARLLCEQRPSPPAVSCGSCPSCLMLRSGSHPDFRLVQPEAAVEDSGDAAAKKKASKQIRIAQLRDLESFFQIGGHREGARVCLLEPAESMNAVTANSLLKILEEPSSSLYFIMVSHRWHSLLPTILSRVRRVLFSAPDAADSDAWLRQAKLEKSAAWLPFFGRAPMALLQAEQGGRLKAMQAMVADLLQGGEPLSVAARWEGHIKGDNGLAMEEATATMQKWLYDLACVACGQSPRYLPHEADQLAAQARALALPALLQAQRQAAQMQRLARHPLNARLFLEDLCVRCMRPLTAARAQ